MKLLLIVVALIVVAGLYLGWFSLSSRTDEGNRNVTLSVDKDKIEADADRAVDKVQDLGHKAAD